MDCAVWFERKFMPTIVLPLPYPINVTFLVPPSTPLAPSPDLTSAISIQELEALPLKVTPPFWIVAFIPDLGPSKEPNKVPRMPSSASYRGPGLSGTRSFLKSQRRDIWS